MLIKIATEKTAGYKLPKNSHLWNQEILKHFFEQNEWINADNYFLKWNSSFDGDKGYGVGVIVLSRGDIAISIPTIVKNFELEPLDIFFFKESFRPLTERTVEQAFSDVGIADKLVDRTKGDAQNLAKDIFPPRWGKYMEVSSSAKRICESLFIDEEDREHLAEQLREAAAHLHGKDEAIDYFKTVLHQENPAEEPEQVKVSSALVSRDPDKGYRVDYIQDGTYHQKVASYIGTHDFLKEAFGYGKARIDELLVGVEKGVVSIETREKVAALSQKDKSEMPAQTITGDAWITTRTKTGRTISGQVIPWTYNFDLRRYTRDKMIVSRDKQVLSFSEDVVGIPRGQDFNSIFANQRVIIARPGMMISFAWRDGGGSGGQSILKATAPAKIIGVEELKGEGVLYHLITAFGSRQRVMPVKGLHKPSFDKKNKHEAIYLPERSVLLQAAESFPPLVTSPEEFSRSITKEGSQIDIARLKESGDILLKGAGLNKSASATAATLYLADLGIDYKKAREVIKTAKALGHTKLYIDKKQEQEKVASNEAALDKLVEDLRTIKTKYNLVKVASEIKQVDALDKVLSLNLINKRNLITFFKMLPHFKETIEQLTYLLVATRLGKTHLDKVLISDAVEALQFLVEKMEGFKTNTL